MDSCGTLSKLETDKPCGMLLVYQAESSGPRSQKHVRNSGCCRPRKIRSKLYERRRKTRTKSLSLFCLYRTSSSLVDHLIKQIFIHHNIVFVLKLECPSSYINQHFDFHYKNRSSLISPSLRPLQTSKKSFSLFSLFFS